MGGPRCPSGRRSPASESPTGSSDTVTRYDESWCTTRTFSTASASAPPTCRTTTSLSDSDSMRRTDASTTRTSWLRDTTRPSTLRHPQSIVGAIATATPRVASTPASGPSRTAGWARAPRRAHAAPRRPLAVNRTATPRASSAPRPACAPPPARRAAASPTPCARPTTGVERRPRAGRATTRSTDAAGRRPLGGGRSSLASADRSSVADGVAAASRSRSHARRAA